MGVVRKWSARSPLEDDVGSKGSCICPGDPSLLPPPGFADLHDRQDFQSEEYTVKHFGIYRMSLAIQAAAKFRPRACVLRAAQDLQARLEGTQHGS